MEPCVCVMGVDEEQGRQGLTVSVHPELGYGHELSVLSVLWEKRVGLIISVAGMFLRICDSAR